MKRVRRLALTVVVAGGLSGASFAAFAPAAHAAPIVCPGGQTATKTSDGWVCYNNGDNPTGAGRHNGNGDKL